MPVVQAYNLERWTWYAFLVSFYNLPYASEAIDYVTLTIARKSEMCFSGYVFPTFQGLKPYLESPPHGPTSSFYSTLTQRLACYVVAGYPERLQPLTSNDDGQASALPKPPHSETEVQRAGNSAVLFGPQGELVGNYRKSNLFTADLPWAQAGDGFKTFDLPPPINRLSIAICMDLNPNPLTKTVSPEDFPQELAQFCLDSQVDVLVVPCAWLNPETDLDSNWALSTVNYWCHRLSLLWEDSEHSTKSQARATTVVICNRTGTERGTTFAGTSTVLHLEHGKGRPEVVGLMGRKDEKCVVWKVPS